MQRHIRAGFAALSLCALVPCPGVFAADTPLPPVNSLVSNGGFENNTDGWGWMTANGARVTGALDSSETHSGKQSYRLTGEGEQTPHVYGRLFRTVFGLRPFTTYRIRTWAKGKGVGIAWIGGGPGWYLRKAFPMGDFDWQQFETEYTTGAEAGDFELMVLVESHTTALWVDDIEMTEIRADTAKRDEAEHASRASLEAEIAHLDRVRTLIQSRPALQSDRYANLGVSVAARYLARVQRLAGELTQGDAWSRLQVEEVRQVLDATEKYLAGPLAGLPGQNVAQPATVGKVSLRDNGVFYVDTLASAEQKPVNRPFYFAGYGHFGQVAKDLPAFPDLGVSLVQQERGPAAIIDEEGKFLPDGRSIVDTLRTAAANRVRVDLLLSPHYFPEWAVKKAPEVRISNPGFLSFDIDHPVARDVTQKHLHALLPAVVGIPSLFSFCLSNEPVYAMSGRTPHSLPLWTAYLRRQHQNIATVNALYGTQYARLEEVPVPAIGMPKDIGPQRAYYDWVRFNQEHFADWHRWMSGLAHKEAPGVPTHAKIMVFYTFERGLLHFGVDPELFCDATDIAGCDAYAFFRNDLLGRFQTDSPPANAPAFSGDFAYSWLTQEMFYDLLHSFRQQTVFNSENHIIPDGSPPQHIPPPEHTRAAFWQGGLHHQGATTTWVWEEAFDPSLAGSIYFRPANAWAAGRAFLDLNRLSDAVAAVNRQPPRVAILYSQPSIFWEADYGGQVSGLYTCLTFLGQPVTFVSEKQLASGKYANVDAIVLPHATHVSDAAVSALRRFVNRGGKLLTVGAGNLERDEYDRPRTLAADFTRFVALPNPADRAAFLAGLQNTLPKPGTLTTTTAPNHPAWGVEFRVVPPGPKEKRNSVLVPLINFLPESQTVRLALPNTPTRAVDLLSGETIDLTQIRLPSLVPRLLQIEQAR